MKYDFSGWATRSNVKCSDGRTIMRDAFKHNDGQVVPLVWNHQHNDPTNVLGHALLENRSEGVYAYCALNDTEAGRAAKLLVQHGDIASLSIYANKLKQRGGDVFHGAIREVSLVIAGANPSAFIDTVIQHSDNSDEEAIVYSGEEGLCLYHSDDIYEEDDVMNEEYEVYDEYDEYEDELEDDYDEYDDEYDEFDDEYDDEYDEYDEYEVQHSGIDGDVTIEDVFNTLDEDQKTAVYALIGQALNGDADFDIQHSGIDGDETIEEVFDTLSETQKDAVYAIIGQAMEDDDYFEGDVDMKHNVFDQDEMYDGGYLTHADEMAILDLAKQNNVGSFKQALQIYTEENGFLQHGFEDVTELFPDYEWVKPGAPEMITTDQTWIDGVLGKVHKSPISRVRMRQADLRQEDIRALGYTKAEEKILIGQIPLLKRSFDPQTVYVKDQIDRDDIIDITDFDVVAYQQKVMRMALNEELAKAIMIGDGRDDMDEHKIKEAHIRSIWNDDELYTIHADVDIEAARQELQGGDTSKHFGENYIYAEAIITAALYAREKYKGSGSLDFYCTPHLLNVMLLARDLNGRRIYDSKSDLAAALNVGNIYTAEQFENKIRTDKDKKQHKLLGLFVNLADYQIGSTKGGQITNFDDFDIDFNQYKYLMETRLSGALTKVFSAIALEEPVAAVEG